MLSMNIKRNLKLILDVKTRWNSIIMMVQRFILLSKSINKTLKELKRDLVTAEEINFLKKILEVLQPLEISTRKLSDDKATLITAEVTYKFLFQNLAEINTELSESMLLYIKKRMGERRNKTFITLILYLEKGKVPQSTEYLKYSTKKEAIELGISLIIKLFENIIPKSCDNDNSGQNAGETETVEIVESLEQLDNMISQIFNSDISETCVDKNTYIEKLFKNFEGSAWAL